MKKKIKIKRNIASEYISMAPLALALERIVECKVLSDQEFERPLLDIGCGEGLFAKILFAEIIDTGIDPDSHELSRARELGAYSELIECYGDKIPKSDGSYRTILSNSVIEHIPDINPIFKEAIRLLVPGGHMYITVPTNHFEKYTWISQILSKLRMSKLQERFGVFFNRFWSHYHFYTPKQWQEIATKAGFEVIEIREYGSRRACLLNDFLVPFSMLEFLTKKLTNRWTLFPRLRNILLMPISFIALKIIDGSERAKPGGLVFLSLKKPS